MLTFDSEPNHIDLGAAPREWNLTDSISHDTLLFIIFFFFFFLNFWMEMSFDPGELY